MPKHKLQRFAENLTFPNLFQVSYDYLRQEGFEWRGRWSEYFGNDNPIVLELGCGKGDYTVALAQRNANKNYIGVDIKGARLWRGAKTSNEEQMHNVAFIRTRIEMIDMMFAADEVSEIWVTFPDPQPKKPNKRLTSERFLSLYKRIARPSTTLHLKTDSQELYEYTLNEVIPAGGYSVDFATDNLYGAQSTTAPVSTDIDDALSVQTFYESGYLKEGKPITYIRFKI